MHFEFLFLLSFRYINDPASIVKYEQKLQRAYAKLKPEEKIDSEEIQWFVHGSIAFAHTLELIAWDLKAMQEATTAWAKRTTLGGQVAQKGGTISEFCAFCLKKKEKEEEQAWKKKESKKKAGRKANEFSAGSNLISCQRSPSIGAIENIIIRGYSHTIYI